MSGKPAFIYCDYADSASATATDSLSGTDPESVLIATEDTVWSPADATGEKDIVIDLLTPFAFDSTAFLGENLDGLQVLTTTSTDNFATDEDYSLHTDLVTNGDFATGDLTGWTVTPAVNVTIAADATGATFTSTGVSTSGNISQTPIFDTTSSYFVKFTIVSISTADLSVRVGPDGAGATGRTAVGTYTQIFTAVALPTLRVSIQSDAAIIVGDSVKITDIEVYKLSALSSVSNAAIIQYPTAASNRYIKYTIANPSTALQIAHICPDTLTEQPWLEKDPISEDVSPTFNNLISSGGLFLGNNQIRTMRAIDIDFGQVTDSEYTGQIEPWIDSRIKVAKPFYFLPDSSNTDEIYFCWLEDNQGLKAPLVNSIRTVSPISAKTRLV